MIHKRTHSVMFHHFHSDKHLPSQGSLSASNFIDIINWLNKNYNLLDACEYQTKLKNKTLLNNDICLSFDDALKCQYDIAVPIINELGIKAFFFVYSSVFNDKTDLLEVYRYFRTSSYSYLDKFYSDFFEIVKEKNVKEYSKKLSKFSSLNYLSEFPFYSQNDRWFRYLRDQYLTNIEYQEIMSTLMLRKGFDITLAKNILWMTEQDLLEISNKGHIIGLHSYSHPTQISKLEKSDQELEYKKNYEHLKKIIKKPITSMSHPCGSYNNDTLNILKSMKIEIGFRSNMSIKETINPLEVPREDHINVFNEMNK